MIEEWEQARFKAEDSEAAHQCEQHSLAEFLQIGQDTIRLVLERLAFQAHANQGSEEKDTADIAAKDLTHQLLCAAKSNGQKTIDALEICEYLRDRVGILYHRGGNSELDAIYTFPHRSFQEYLAAAYFRREEDSLFEGYQEYEDWQALAAHLASTDPDRWREVIMLAGGIKAQKEPGPVWDLLDALYPEAVDELSQENAWALRLAGEILAENLKHDDLNRKQKRIFERIRQALPGVLSTSQLPAIERAATGRHLAVIGDPRKAIMEVDKMPFCLVPAGVFWMGKGAADEKGDELLSETPAGEYDLDYDYWLAKYPVSVAQFRQFANQSQWPLEDKRCLNGNANDPVVYVNWRDAMAFCQWLTQCWQSGGGLPQDLRVTLPNEPEWEKAARGGLQVLEQPMVKTVSGVTGDIRSVLQDNILPQRRYPWGDQMDDECLNYAMNIGQVSSPGVHPRGQSLYGCEDLSGNVWEWTRSKQEDYPYPKSDTDQWRQREVEDDARRVLRGGAFYCYRRRVRAAVRFFYPPYDRDFGIGFRVCLSPFL